MKYYIAKNFDLYLKFFKQNLLANSITTYCQGILVLIKPESLLTRNIISLALERIFKSILKAITFI